MNLQSQFCNCEQSLILKESGFDEPCFAYYDNLGEFYSIKLLNFFKNSEREEKDLIAAPLFQQAVEWLAKKGLIIQTIWHPTINGKCLHEDVTKEIHLAIDEAIKILKSKK